MKQFSFTILFSVLSYALLAQNTTNAPSSMYGIGEIHTGEGGQYAGMGGVSIALRGDNFINTANPASLTGLADNRFILDAGLAVAYEAYTQSGARNNSFVGNLNNMAIGCRIVPWWYAAVALSPVSSVGYAITLEEEVQGAPGTTSASFFEGEGGLSKISISNGFRVIRGLSVGVNLSYISGTIKQTETMGSTYETLTSFKYTLYSDFGLQYQVPLKKDQQELIIGVTYGYSQKLAQDNELFLYNSSSGETIDRSDKKVSQYMPQFFGIGIGYSSLRYKLSTEYKYIDWSSMESGYSTAKYQGQSLWKAGASYVVGDPYKNPLRLMVGMGLQNSYLSIKGKSDDKYYVSAGVGVTLKSNVVSLGMKYQDALKNASSLPREQRMLVYLNWSFSERVSRFKVQ